MKLIKFYCIYSGFKQPPSSNSYSIPCIIINTGAFFFVKQENIVFRFQTQLIYI